MTVLLLAGHEEEAVAANLERVCDRYLETQGIVA